MTTPIRPRARRWALLWLSCAALAVAGPASSPVPVAGQELRAQDPLPPAGAVSRETSRKIGSRLRALIGEFRARGITQGNAAAMDAQRRYSSELLRVDPRGRVQVYVSLADTKPETLDALRRHDLQIEIVNEDFGIVQGWVPVGRLEDLAAEPAVVVVRPPSYASHDTGPVNTEGDAIHRCDQARALGYDGSGVKVGVVSDGVSGLAASQAAGELGAVEVLSPGSGDEGTAMLEIVHDCAPGAWLAFAPAGTSLQFMQSVNALHAAGAQIIVDDVAAFVTEPVFEDSPTALNDRAIGAMALRISSGGNRGQGHYRAAFTPAFPDPEAQGGVRHHFGNGLTLLRFRVAAAPGGNPFRIVLQWSNRFGAAADDYDLCVRNTTGQVVACSFDRQNGNGDPLEAVLLACFGPFGGSCLGDIQVTRFAGAGQQVALFCDPSGGCVFDPTFNVRGGSVVGHKGVPEVLAVGAVPASDPTVLELFSAGGPTTILFPQTDIRFKPDLVAVNRVSTSRPGFNPFAGTSAAAPHVAGVAALAMEAMRPGATPAAVRTLLKATAVDLGVPGPDVGFGFGRADARAAVEAAGEALCMPNATTLCLDDQPGDGRFQVRAAFQTTQGGGSAGDAQAIPLASLGVTHGGLMWFFSADNPEMLVKILPGCNVTGHFWVFASAGTNVGLVITVKDLRTGTQKVYTNPDVNPMFPIQDTFAFPC